MKNTLLAAIQQKDAQIQNKLPHSPEVNLTPLDACLKWAPLTLLMTADAAGLKMKSNFRQRALRVIVAEAILNAAMLPVKRIVNRIRPNGHSKSFPSGHSATGFLSSHILYEELKEANPALSYGGYALSFATCLLRLYHNKHWFSDVAAGALLGVISAMLSAGVMNELKDKQPLFERKLKTQSQTEKWRR